MKFTKKNKIICFSIILSLFFVILFFLILSTLQKSKTTRIAFYDLPENVSNSIQKEISDFKGKDCKFTILDSSKPLPLNISKKYSILFSWKNKTTEEAATKAVEFAPEVYNVFPTNIAKSSKVDGKYLYMPILLDHFEISYYETFRKNAELNFPSSFTSLKSYLQDIKEYAQIPLICAGSDDESLFSFVSVFSDSLLGYDGYKEIIENLSKMHVAKDELPKKLTLVLDEIKEFQNENLIPQNWTSAQEKDVDTLMENHMIDAICMKLSMHRTKNLLYISHYEAMPFPPEDLDISHTLVAPEVCAVMFEKKNDEAQIVNNLLSMQTQINLSENTKLAPVTSRAQSYDMQADDVRYWAAIYPAGPNPDIFSAAFASKKDKEKIAERIRNYLK